MGRPTDLTPVVHKHIVNSVRKGNFIITSAAAAGIGKSAFYSWMQRGEKESEGIYCDFFNDVEEAKALAEIDALDVIIKSSPENWQAAAWRLERRYPDRWAKKVTNELTGPNNGPIQHKDVSEARQHLISKLISEITDEEEEEGT